jgi:hypothetical protein
VDVVPPAGFASLARIFCEKWGRPNAISVPIESERRLQLFV